MELNMNDVPTMALYVAAQGSEKLPHGVTIIENAEEGCVCKYMHPSGLDLPPHVKDSITACVVNEPSYHWFVFKTFTQAVVYKVCKAKLVKETSSRVIQGAMRGFKVRAQYKTSA